MKDHQIKEAAEVFKAMSEPSRLLLLQHLLSNGRCSVGELVEHTGLSQANVSKHLKILAQVDLIRCERQGNFVMYEIASSLVNEICSICCTYIDDKDMKTLQALQSRREIS